MKVLGGELEQSVGDVMLQLGLRLGKLNPRTSSATRTNGSSTVVMQGHVEMWQAMQGA